MYSTFIKPTVALINQTGTAINIRRLFFALNTNPADGLVIDFTVYRASSGFDPITMRANADIFIWQRGVISTIKDDHALLAYPTATIKSGEAVDVYV
mmetsp:Transcript_26539/g.4662  ORF Transcript_26539/g.4662 Transcript_26539/m.4662 type:complete len:97 (+) Transcript_26539:1333-1623(+)